eukprot:451258_1
MVQMSTILLATLLWLVVYTQCRPNIIIIYPDNQDLLLGSTASEYMPILNSHIINNGITLNNGFVSTPICCPSRAELLTGRYYHNQGPPAPPNGTCMHVDPYHPVFDNNTLFQIMYNAGYHVGAFGKIVNDMPFWCNSYKNNDTKPVIKGLSRLYIPCNYLNYYGHVYFDKFENDSYTYAYTNTSYTSPSLFETSQIGNATIDWIDEIYSNNLQNGGNSDDISFFALWGVHAPHYPATPAAWYQNRFNDTDKYFAPRTPNFNQHYPNKHWLVDEQPELDELHIGYIDQWWRNRLRSMLSVEDFIYTLDETLTKWNIINNTYIFYVSDNGMHLGQFRITNSFRNIYETDIRVPFFIRGPGITAKSNMDQMVSNVDIAPTIYELAGIDIDRNKYNVDGISFAKYLFEPNGSINGNIDDTWRDILLFEYIWVKNSTMANYQVWYPTNTSYMGKNVVPECCNDMGQPYRVDNSFMCSFRSLRIINDTFNITYAEYIHGTYTDDDLNNPMFYEMYNLTNDPWQTNNIYNETDGSTKTYLQQTLRTYGACKAEQCP